MNDVHERFLRQGITLARQARAAGNHPFGALLVLDGEVVASAQNTVFTHRDPTAHAETNLVSHAIRELSPDVCVHWPAHSHGTITKGAEAGNTGRFFCHRRRIRR